MTITIDGTTGIASVDGSAGSPSVRGSDANSGILYAADAIKFSTGGVQRAVIDNNGLSAAGHIVQVVYAKLDTAFLSTTTDGVDTGLSATINVQDASNKLFIICSALWASEGNWAYMYLSDGSNNVIEQPGASGSRGRFHWGPEYNGDASSNFHYHSSRDTFHCVTTPGSTGNYTVKLRANNNSSVSNRCVHLNRNVNNDDRYYDPIGISTLTVMEVAA